MNSTVDWVDHELLETEIYEANKAVDDAKHQLNRVRDEIQPIADELAVPFKTHQFRNGWSYDKTYQHVEWLKAQRRSLASQQTKVHKDLADAKRELSRLIRREQRMLASAKAVKVPDGLDADKLAAAMRDAQSSLGEMVRHFGDFAVSKEDDDIVHRARKAKSKLRSRLDALWAAVEKEGAA